LINQSFECGKLINQSFQGLNEYPGSRKTGKKPANATSAERNFISASDKNALIGLFG
jgi:hypothetical protein